MRRSSIAILACFATLAVGACQRTDTATPPAATSPSPNSTAPATDGDDDVTMRYTCDSGHAVAIAGQSARVTLSDGRTVVIDRVADSSPPRFSGEALSFSVTEDGGELGQDEVGGFDCRAAD